MKQFVLLFTLSAFSLAGSAHVISTSSSHIPKVYIMMRKGKLFEIRHGHSKLVKKNVTLVNQTTIHPNGAIDSSNGQSLQLKEGDYVTMDGKVRHLKDMGH
jgi:hypothetical protein